MAGCSLEKKSGFNRNMQNLTAHYNILFNANEILRKKQESYAENFTDNYNELLNVYPDTTTQTGSPDKDLEEAISKGNKIINIKEQSHYLGDAYVVIGKANFLEGNYFNANEFLDYVIKSFPQQPQLVQEALVWKARSLMYLQKYSEAKIALDTAIKNIDPKKKRSIDGDIYASRLQYDIDTQDYNEAEEMAKQAVSLASTRLLRLRWMYILAQLQELNQKPNEAVKNYAGIANSNVSFEMAFNASLNVIKIEDTRNGVKETRTARLLALLKEPNNKEFKDQIYYHVAQLQMGDKDVDGAIKSYQLSVRNSVINRTQKGMSYLRLAEIYFKNKADYLKSKAYYDSTLMSLPPNYPSYAAIKTISNNLSLLAKRYQTIAREDTLQALAKLDSNKRSAIIDKMVSDFTLQQKKEEAAALAAATTPLVNETAPGGKSGSGGSSFYFYNSNAVSTGFADFKRKWGNRKLEDNWRRSNRNNSDITANTINTQSIDPDAPVGLTVEGRTRATNNAGDYRKALIKDLPLTPEKLAQSNLRVYNAYIDIANFYRDILNDKKEAIANYELVLKRFPDDQNKPAIYYNLYRLYSDIDKTKSDYYKDLLLRNYANTNFAKVILDPEFAKRLDNQNAEFDQAYDRIFELYTQKQYKEVIAAVPQMLTQYPGNKYASQLYYLKTLSEGHNEKAGPFTDSLRMIKEKYPTDKLITPLIDQHLNYIAANLAEIQGRTTVIPNAENPQEIPFTLDPAQKKETAYRPAVNMGSIFDQKPQERIERQQQLDIAQNTQAPKISSAAIQPASIQQQALNPANAQVPISPDSIVTKAAPTVIKKQEIITPSIFSNRDSTDYYFAVDVKSATTNLASTRFGFGQFNRVNYQGKGIKHQLFPVGKDDQVIVVGRFYSLADVKDYARKVIPLLPDIMKVPKEKYSFFIITQENLNKLADEKTLNSYIDYYQKSF